MRRLFNRSLLFTLVLSFTLTGAALRANHTTGTPTVTEPESHVNVQQSEPGSDAAQGQAQAPTLKSFSPLGIEFFIEDNPKANLKPLWRRLHIYPDFGEGEDPSATQPFLETCDECKAELFEYDLDEEPGKEVLLRIEDGLVECRYLIFKRAPSQSSQDQWKLLGHIDWDSGKYRMPQHTVVVSGGQTWLLIEVADGSGSGYSHYSYRLFKVESSGVKELLSFPSEGYQSWCGPFPVQTFSSRVINCSSDGRLTTVEVEFSVAYHSDFDTSDRRGLLWAKKQRAVYTGEAQKGKLVLDPVNSDLSEQEIEAVYENDTLHCGDIFKYNLSDLRGIAKGRNAKRRAWLQAYLDQCKGGPEKQELEQLLKQSNEKM